MWYKIYYLSSSRDPTEVRYVGRTIKSLNARLRGHLNSKKKTHNKNWIDSVLNRGYKVLINEIERWPEERPDREQYWIKYYKDLGVDLNNHTEGGDGMLGYKLSKNSLLKNPFFRASKEERAIWAKKGRERLE